MKSFGVVNAHIQVVGSNGTVYILHANFVIPFLFVWRIILDEFIMLCIDYHQFLEG
jgi:hypothetical protein